MKTFEIKNPNYTFSVSKIIFGTTYLGNMPDHQEGFRQMDCYFELGGRCIDTARAYSNLAPEDRCPSETVIGEWLRKTGVRKEIVLSTKGGHPEYGDMSRSRLDEHSLREDLKRSLDALQQDFIDIYWLHRDNTAIPVGELVDLLNEFIDAGSVGCIGASNWSAERILEANQYAAEHGKIGFSASQIQWSLGACTPLDLGDETLVCMDEKTQHIYAKENIPVMAFNAQSKGLFSKLAVMPEDQLPEKIRKRFLNERNRNINLTRFDKVKVLCDQYGVSPAVIALAYITSHSLSAGAIIGCSNIVQLRDSMGAQDFSLTPDEVMWLADDLQ
jgi:aryl-alcohol dehydrogenase-like predicted oxidoreductase